MKRIISIELTSEDEDVRPFREVITAGPFTFNISDFSSKKIWIDIRREPKPAGSITGDELDLLIAALQDARATIG